MKKVSVYLVQREDKSTAIYTAKDVFITSASLTEIEENVLLGQYK